MNAVALRGILRWPVLLSRRVALLASAITALGASLVAADTNKNPAAADLESVDNDKIISLAAYNVKADRIEDFGLRVTSSFYSKQPKGAVGFFLSKFIPIITDVVPNTAAARAGLRPGERILKSEGQVTVGGLFSTGKLGKWHKTQARKWAEVAAGKSNVTWTLEVETPATRAVRTVRLVVPTPPPHWGSAIWQKPQGRRPALIEESGPLAERCSEIMDNGIWTLVSGDIARALGADVEVNVSGFPTGVEPTGYRWEFGSRQGVHWIVVTQYRGRTDVFLETRSSATGRRVYLTSPTGLLVRAWQWTRKEKKGEVPVDEAREGFETELDFWSTEVERVSGRWPFAIKPGYDANAIFAVLAAKEGISPAVQVVRPPAGEFLKLRRATEAEQALFSEAFGKIGADADQWAYTETSHGLEDRRTTVMRVDPSKPPNARCLLVSIDGKMPTAADVQQWRDDGGDTPKPLGELPPFASLVDLKDVRIVNDEPSETVFELPIRSDQADFPAERFQVLFRVNKAHRSLENISVKLRDGFRVAGVVKVADAGWAMRFQTLDPSLAPQAVWLKAGGGVRVLLVKFARSFEATRTDFHRVVPFLPAKTD